MHCCVYACCDIRYVHNTMLMYLVPWACTDTALHLEEAILQVKGTQLRAEIVTRCNIKVQARECGKRHMLRVQGLERRSTLISSWVWSEQRQMHYPSPILPWFLCFKAEPWIFYASGISIRGSRTKKSFWAMSLWMCWQIANAAEHGYLARL